MPVLDVRRTGGRPGAAWPSPIRLRELAGAVTLAAAIDAVRAGLRLDDAAEAARRRRRGFGGPEEACARFFEQVLGLLERLADDSRVVLAIEGAHRADRSSRDLLSFLVRYQRSDAGQQDWWLAW